MSYLHLQLNSQKKNFVLIIPYINCPIEHFLQHIKYKET